MLWWGVQDDQDNTEAVLQRKALVLKDVHMHFVEAVEPFAKQSS